MPQVPVKLLPKSRSLSSLGTPKIHKNSLNCVQVLPQVNVNTTTLNNLTISVLLHFPANNNSSLQQKDSSLYNTKL